MGWRKNSLGAWERDEDENSRANRVWTQIPQPKTEGKKLEEKGVGEDGYIDEGAPITDELGEDGRPLAIHGDASVRVKTGITDYLEDNKEFNEAVRKGNLKEGVEIKRRKGEISSNPLENISQFAGAWDESRQNIIDTSAQKVDDVLTSVGNKLNVPGTDFIADRARNITGFTADMLYPESWELPLIATAAAIPADGPLGEAAIYGGGVINRGRRFLKVGSVAAGKFVDDLLNNVTGHISNKGWVLADASGNSLNGKYFSINKIDNNPNIMQSKGINDGWVNPMRQPEVPQVIRQALGNAGIRDNGTFHLDTYLKNRKSLTSKERRALAGLFMTDPMKGFTGKNMDQALTSYTNRVKQDFMKVYTPEFLAKYKIDPSQIQLHHINALLSSLPLYDGVRYMSKEWMEITGTLLSKNVHSGHSVKNLRFLVGRSKDFRTPHGITHKYLDEVVGADGDKFFKGLISHNGKSITRLEYMKLSDANRVEVVNDWADIVNKGNSITDQAVGVFNAINADLLNLKAENIDEIMSSLGKLQSNGLVKPELIDGKWQIAQKEMRELLFDIDFTENIGQHFLQANPRGLRALRIALQSEDPISGYRAIKATLPKQLSLFSNDKVKALAKKTRRYKDKRWDIPDDVPPPRGEGEFPETGELDEYGRPL